MTDTDVLVRVATDPRFLSAFERDMGRVSQAVDRSRRRMEQDLSQLDRSFNRRFRSIRAGARGLQVALGRLSPAGRGIGALAGVGLGGGTSLAALLGGGGVAAGAIFIRNTVNELGRLGDTADKLGQTAEELQGIRFAAEEIGVATQTTDLAIQRFTRRLGEAQAGAGELLPIIEEYGIALRDANGVTRTASEVLLDLATVTAAARNPQEQLRIAFKAFDSEGAALVNLLRLGSEGVRDFIARAEDLNLVIGEDSVRAAQRAEREFDRFFARIKVGAQSASLNLLESAFLIDRRPEIEVLSDTFDSLGSQLDRVQRELRALEENPSLLSGRPNQGRQRRIDDLTNQFERLNRELRITARELNVATGAAADFVAFGQEFAEPLALPRAPGEFAAAVPIPPRRPVVDRTGINTIRARPIPNPLRDAAREAAEAIELETTQLEQLTEAFAESTMAGEEMLRFQTAMNEARELEGELGEEQAQALVDEIKAREDASAALQDQIQATAALEAEQERALEAAMRRTEQRAESIRQAFGAAFGDLARNINEPLAALERLQQRLLDIAADAVFQRFFGGFDFGSFGGGLGLLSSLFGGGGGFSFAGSASAGLAGTGLDLLTGHQGGIVRSLPRYHRGRFPGLRSNEELAVLEQGEEVLTDENPRHIRNVARGGRRSGLTVQFIMPPGTDADQMNRSAGQFANRLDRAVASRAQRIR